MGTSLLLIHVLIGICPLVYRSSARYLPPPEVIDLSYPYDDTTYYWPVAGKPKGFNMSTIFKGTVEGGAWYQAYEFCTREHGGTHLDAPSHFYKRGWTIDQIPVDRFIAPAVVVDIRDKAKSNPDAKLEVSDLEEWEEENGRIPLKAIVILFSGWGKHWGNLTAYVGNEEDNPADFHFPGFDIEASKWLLRRNIVGIGTDTASVDPGTDKLFRTHVALAKENIFNLENVANVDKLPPKGSTIVASPIKLKGGSGGPTRLLAVTGQGNYPSKTLSLFAVQESSARAGP